MSNILGQVKEMKILTRQDVKTGQIFANVVLTEAEVDRLVAGETISGELPEIQVQIVGYGEDES